MTAAPATRIILLALSGPIVLFLGAGPGFPSDGKGHAHSSPPAASASASPGSGGSTAERRLGPSGGLSPNHSHTSRHIVVLNPWWGWGGFGWGWPYAGFWGYDAWYPASGYSQFGPSSGAVIELHISPRKASVRLDGNDVGQARDFNSAYGPLFIPPGSHVVEFVYPGYKSLKVRVDGVDGQSLNLRYDLVKGEGVDSRSEQAEISEPSPFSAPTGSSVPNTNASGEPTLPAPTPAPAGSLRVGKVRIHVEPEDAAVYLDGEFLGTADEINRLHGAFSVPAGEHKVEAVRPGRASRSVTVVVRDDEPATVRLILPPDSPG